MIPLAIDGLTLFPYLVTALTLTIGILVWPTRSPTKSKSNKK